MKKEDKTKNMASCMLSILDSLKLFDLNSLDTSQETLSEIMFRKMKGYNIDLNKELDFDHLKPIPKKEQLDELKSDYHYRISIIESNLNLLFNSEINEDEKLRYSIIEQIKNALEKLKNYQL